MLQPGVVGVMLLSRRDIVEWGRGGRDVVEWE